MWNNIRRINDDAMQTFRNNYKELTRIIHKQEEKIQFLETKALHLSMFYVASQLVIFLSNSKPSPYQCRNWWKPFFLSLSIAVVFGLNFATTVIKYVRTKYEQDRNFLDQGENYHQMAYLERHGKRNNRDINQSLEIDMTKVNMMEPDVFGVYKRYAHIWVTVFALLGFTGLVLHACRSSVCADAVWFFLILGGLFIISRDRGFFSQIETKRCWWQMDEELKDYLKSKPKTINLRRDLM